MTDKPARTNIINKLTAAQANVETMSPDEIRAVLAEAIEAVRTLRLQIGIRDDMSLEEAKPPKAMRE